MRLRHTVCSSKALLEALTIIAAECKAQSGFARGLLAPTRPHLERVSYSYRVTVLYALLHGKHPKALCRCKLQLPVGCLAHVMRAGHCITMLTISEAGKTPHDGKF